jgi:glycine betaine/proline transport system permease protein
MDDWLAAYKIPLGKWMSKVVDLLNEHAAFLFNATSDGLGFLIEGLIELMQATPPLALIALFAALAYWLHRSLGLVALIVFSLLLIMNLGYWAETVETLALVIFATGLCMLIGVPVGIAAAHRPWLYTAIRPVLDLMQTIPTFVYLIPALILFGLGVVPGLISTIIFAIPAPIRLTYLGVASAPKPLIEAGEAFGATRRQLLWKVELPHAMPTIMAGLTQCIMLSLSMVVIAALVGAGGLGKPVVRALNTVNIAQGFEAGLAIVLVAILLDRVCKQRGAARAGG